MRQQNWDGGLPQLIEPTDLEFLREQSWMGTNQPRRVLPAMGKKSISTASGRALPAMNVIYRITEDPRHKLMREEMEQFAVNRLQRDFWFTGHHPDLPPQDFEEASIWGVCEYWLDRYADSGEPEYLKHAEANFHLAMTWWCPKQLSWVKNPTQFCAAEQQHYFTYTNYCYQNRKIECITRLYDLTKNPLYKEVAEANTQGIYFTQTTEKNDKLGGTYERTSDPWLARPLRGGERDFNSLGPHYMNEQSLDLFLQILEMYRKGTAIYFGESISHKIYPDGTIYYSADVGEADEVALSALPSLGTIEVDVSFWNDATKKWTVAASQKSTVSFSVGSLVPNSWVQVNVDEEELGIFHASTRGEIKFSYTDDFSKSHIFTLVQKGDVDGSQ
jgi:hypothetical protein